MTIKPIHEKGSYFPYREFVLVIIVAQYLFENYINWRQIKRLKNNKKVPSELQELKVSEEEYTKSNQYTRAKMEFEFVQKTFTVIVQVARIIIYFGPWIWEVAGTILTRYGYDPNSEYYRAMVLVVIDMVIDKVLNISFDIYRIFVLEGKFGLNKTTPLLFLKDEIIAMLLKVTLAPLSYAAFLWAIEKGGDYFYIYAGIVTVAIVFLMLWIYPTFIAPLFNKFSELQEGTLRDSLYKLAETVQFPLKNLFVCDGSKRSAHSNAYFYGFGNNKRIVLFDTLMNHLDEKEIEAVLAHEIGHWKLNHTIKQMALQIVQIFALFYVYGFFMREHGIFRSFGYKEESIFIGYSLFLMVFTPLQLLLKIVMLKLSRRYEFQADHFAHSLNYGKLLSTGLIKIQKENLSDPDPDPVYASFHYTHPTLLERIRYLNQLSSKVK